MKIVNAIVQPNKKQILAMSLTAVFAAILGACSVPVANTSGGGSVDSNETAAKVNGKVITMQEVDRAVKQQSQGQESKLSPLELAAARLQVLQGLVEQEVMYQKAEKENMVPSEEDVTGEINKRKVDSRLSVEEFDKQMKQAGLDDKSFRDSAKRALAIQKLVDKVTSRIETPKDQEIADFFKSNPDLFVRKRGVRLAAIVIDPSDGGEGDMTRNEVEASQKVKEVLAKVQQPASDFAALAREFSEDPSKLQGGDLGYISEEELKQNFGANIAAAFMNPQFNIGQVTNMVPVNGKGYIFKLQERVEKEENLTLDSPDVRPQINKLLVDNRKQLLAASYQAIAMNEAKIENYLAKKVVDNPNELSGTRPAGAVNANTSGATNSNTSTNTMAAANANTSTKPEANAKPADKPAEAKKPEATNKTK
ncbi:MAG: SurA N-terminal domain-containing protein [Chloracidobacterium sp.]|nr:SurA N-terminal domain-containing protein [Chloracidobacterium sp.]